MKENKEWFYSYCVFVFQCSFANFTKTPAFVMFSMPIATNINVIFCESPSPLMRNERCLRKLY